MRRENDDNLIPHNFFPGVERGRAGLPPLPKKPEKVISHKPNKNLLPKGARLDPAQQKLSSRKWVGEGQKEETLMHLKIRQEEARKTDPST